MTLLIITLSITLIIGAIIVAFRPIIPSALLSYAAMWLLDTTNIISISNHNLLFWGIATIIILIINMSQTQKIKYNGLFFIVIGTLMGSCIGMVLSPSAIIIGAALGAIFGLISYYQTPNGRTTKLSPSIFIMQLASMGLPTIVSMSIIAFILFQVSLNPPF